MPIRTLLRYLANNDQLVQKIAESYPVRRAAQLAVAVFYKGKGKMPDLDPQKAYRIWTLLKKINVSLKDGFKQLKK